MRDRLAELENRVSSEMAEIMRDEGGVALSRLSDEVTSQLAQLVPGGEVQLAAKPPSVKVPSLSVDLRVLDDGLDTVVGRQGHGFQRALLIAVVQQLATANAASQANEDKDDETQPTVTPPALMLALEEPELYQHPLQARHFAATLTALAGQGGAPVQVCYATHSEHFVDPAQYARLRRFQRLPGREWPESSVTEATVDRVVERLKGVFDPDQIPLRVQMTLRRQVAEAVFAKAVILVEGDSDVGLLHGLGDRTGGLDALGIAVVKGHNKRQLLIPWAILTELRVPTYAIFDGDAGLRERMTRNGKETADIDAAEQAARKENRLVLRTLGVAEDETPPTQVQAAFAVFADRLETELQSWPGFMEAVDSFKDEHGDFRDKPDDGYRHAAATVPTNPPHVFVELMKQVEALVG
jgi:hypothetical protein